MPKPLEYTHAGKVFSKFMEELQLALDSPTSNVTYTIVQSVFIVFRRRLTLKQSISFASTLPAVLRALYVQDWNTDEAILPFANLSELNAEVSTIRQHHNFSPENAIEILASVLCGYVDKDIFSRRLRDISDEAYEFWNPSGFHKD